MKKEYKWGIGIVTVIAIIAIGVALKEKPQNNEPEPTVKSTVAAPTVTSKAIEKSIKEKKPVMLSKVKSYLAKNSDVIGMITIPDTRIDYPVLVGTDNEYYLTHNIDKESDKNGSIYIDYLYKDSNIRKEFLRHTMIYGHNMKNKSMFHDLVNYKEKDFFQSHPYIYFSNQYKTGKWRVFSVYVVDADKETIERTFVQDQKYISYLNGIKKRSMFPVNVTLNKNSKVITLCTCSYETNNARTIIHAVLEK